MAKFLQVMGGETGGNFSRSLTVVDLGGHLSTVGDGGGAKFSVRVVRTHQQSDPDG
jgi:hypothetical protein